MVQFNEEKEEEKIEEIRTKEAEDLAEILSQKYKIPYIDLSKTSIDIDALKIIHEKKAREAKLVVFQKTGKNLQIAVFSPNPQETKDAIGELQERGYKTNLFMASENGIERAWKRYSEVGEFTESQQGIIDISQEKISEFMEEAKSIEGLKTIFSSFTASKEKRRISEIVEIILAGAIKLDASDIHIEPQENNVRMRLRLDGVLHEILSFDFKIYQLLLSRIKLVSGLKLNIKHKAQDGRFSIHILDSEIEIRTSMIPGGYGESIVMRILNPKSISVGFEELGIEPRLFKMLSEEIKRPNGMILTTGPTGSGKTTTLYAILKKILTPEIKAITLEDPIEYHLSGITQTQTNEKQGYDFANGLRSILRQDPDVIMVGEIRDLETAKIAVNAALTGHLVLSTLHTNNAAGAIPRLIDIGANPNAIAPALNVSIAQRLVRKLCDECKEKTKPNAEELEIINKIIQSFPKDFETPDVKDVYIWNPVGCQKCAKIGYKGRMGIFEAVIVNEEIEKMILDNPNERKIKDAAKQQGILNMSQDGILKVIKGNTSLKELQRTVELEI